MKYLKEKLTVIFNPEHWFHGRVSKTWSDVLLKMIEDEVPIERISGREYTCRMSGIDIWVANYPYCFGYIDSSTTKGIYPKAYIKILLKKYIKKCSKPKENMEVTVKLALETMTRKE